MNPQEFQTFADNYTSEDFERISFQWQGGYGADFKDLNYYFRIHLCEYLIPQLNQTKLELIKDLYLEVGKTSDYTFGCYLNFNLPGQELLERGGTAYLTAYLQGAAHTMDTALTSGKINLSRPIGLANNFFGWGIIARLDDMDGIHLPTGGR